MNFNELGLGARLVSRLEVLGLKQPTPIQAKAIPHALQGRDVLGIGRRAVVDKDLVRLRPVTAVGDDHVEIAVAVQVRERQRRGTIRPQTEQMIRLAAERPALGLCTGRGAQEENN